MATTSKFDFGLINDQIKTHTDQIVNLGNALVYVINGDTYTGTTIPNGSFVLWNGVLYTANGAIPAGSVSASNFRTLSETGGMNSLLQTANSKEPMITSSGNVSFIGVGIYNTGLNRYGVVALLNHPVKNATYTVTLNSMNLVGKHALTQEEIASYEGYAKYTNAVVFFVATTSYGDTVPVNGSFSITL